MGSEISSDSKRAFINQSSEVLKGLENPTATSKSPISGTGIVASTQPIDKNLSDDITHLFTLFRTASSKDKKAIYLRLKAVFIKLDKKNLPIKLNLLTKCFKAYTTILGKIGGFINPEIEIKAHPNYTPSDTMPTTESAKNSLQNNTWVLRYDSEEKTFFICWKVNKTYQQEPINSLEEISFQKPLFRAQYDKTQEALFVTIVEPNAQPLIEHITQHSLFAENYKGILSDTEAETLLRNKKSNWILKYDAPLSQVHLCFIKNDAYNKQTVLSVAKIETILKEENLAPAPEAPAKTLTKQNADDQPTLESLQEITHAHLPYELQGKEETAPMQDVNVTQEPEDATKAILNHQAYAGKITTQEAANLLDGIPKCWILRFDERSKTYYLCVMTPDYGYVEARVTSLEDIDKCLDAFNPSSSKPVDIKKLRIEKDSNYVGAITGEEAQALLNNHEEGWLIRFSNTTRSMHLSYKKDGTFVDREAESLKTTMAFIKMKSIKQDPSLLKKITINKFKDHPAYTGILTSAQAKTLLGDRQGWVLRFSETSNKMVLFINETRKIPIEEFINSPEEIDAKLKELRISSETAMIRRDV